MRVVYVVLILFSMLSSVHAGVYKWIDENGKVHFGDKPVDRSKATSVSIKKMNTFKAETNMSTLKQKTVVIYTASWCTVCKTAKRYFKQKNIRFTELDVEKSRRGQRDFQRMKGRAVPIILVGEARLNGFTVAAFEKLWKK